MVLTLTVSGDVGDYADTSNLQRAIAGAAGVDVWFVSIRVAAASVLITATIVVPAATTASAVLAALSSSLGTAAAASIQLGLTVESTPTIKVVDEASPPEGSGGSSAVTIAAAAGGGAAALVLALLLVVAYRTCKQTRPIQVRRDPHYCIALPLLSNARIPRPPHPTHPTSPTHPTHTHPFTHSHAVPCNLSQVRPAGQQPKAKGGGNGATVTPDYSLSGTSTSQPQLVGGEAVTTTEVAS